MTKSTEPKKSKPLLALIPKRYYYLETLTRYIREHVLKGNGFVFGLAVIFGLGVRVLTLCGYALTLQAIVAAIRPELIHKIFNRIVSKFDIPLSISIDQIIPILILAIMVTYGVNWIIQMLRTHLIELLNRRIALHQRNFAAGRTMDDDLFVLEQVPGVVLALDKSVQITLLMILIMLLISLASPQLTLLLIPVLIVLVAVQIYGDRRNLRELKKQQDRRQLYVNHTDPKDGKFRRRPAPQNTEDRDIYLSILAHRRHHANIKPETDAFLSAIAFSLIIYYLSTAGLNMDQLAGLLFLFVVGLRYMISTGRELSVNILVAFNMRKELVLIQNILSNNAPEDHEKETALK